MKKGRTWTKVFIIFGIVLLVAAVALFVWLGVMYAGG